MFIVGLLLGSMLSVDASVVVTDTATIASVTAIDSSLSKGRTSNVPPVVHSAVGDVSLGYGDVLRLVNIGKRQQFSWAERSTFDTDINSPKSVTFSRDGKTVYVNSLEGCRTAIYDVATLQKKDVVIYEFKDSKGELWAPPSGFYQFTHYPEGDSRSFWGKPVENAWSHNYRYLWIPFYRRSFDINAQDPSAVAVVDVRTNKIVRMFETGPIPKVVVASNNGGIMALTHWGDNTVGMIDISSDDPKKWHHLQPIEIGRKLNLDFPLDRTVNRDANSGFLLRGAVFTPDDDYLFVAAMAGPLNVVNVKTHKYVGSVAGLYGLRHLILSGNTLYGTINVRGEVVSYPLDALMSAIGDAEAKGVKTIQLNSTVKRGKVGGGARTIEASPDGKYLFVACNSASEVDVLTADNLKVVDSIRCDSYPVGLAVSPNGRYLAVTSQGRSGKGGNALNIFEIERSDVPIVETVEEPDSTVANGPTADVEDVDDSASFQLPITAFLGAGILLIAIVVFRRRKR